MVPALKLPEPSRLTIVDSVFVSVAVLAKLTPVATFAEVTPPTLATTVAPCVPVTSPTRGPVKLVAEVAVEALPVRLPVTLPVKLAAMVPALKFPETSRLTIVDVVFASVAAFAANSAA